MDEFEAPKPIFNIQNKKIIIIESKEYKLNIDKGNYSLNLELNSDNKIIYKIKQENNNSFYYYKEFNYDELIKTLLLPMQYYDNINKLFNFYDTAISKNKVTLSKTNIDNKVSMILLLKMTIGFDEIESKIIINEIKEINNNNNDLNCKNDEITLLKKKNEELENKLNLLNKKNEELEAKINILMKKHEENDEFKSKIVNKINLLISENNISKNNLNENKTQKIEKIEEIKYQKEHEKIVQKPKIIEEIKKINIDNNNRVEFFSNPQNLGLKKYLSYHNCDSENVNAFEAFIGLKDYIEYIVYCEGSSDLKVMIIKNKTIKYSLKKHRAKVNSIRYFIKDSKEEYLLSCDLNKLIIIWDIQNDYNIKYSIKMELPDYIRDSLLLFNINTKDYILISNEGKKEYTKLYELKENIPFIRNIYGTNENITYYLIPWIYNNKYYIIECCYEKISINNLLEDECYDNLDMPPEGNHYCGYLYNNNYLCVTNQNPGYIRIWDLIKKEIIKEIKYDSNYIYGIIPWNKKFSIVGCYNGFIVINIEEKKVVKKFDIGSTLYCVKIIKTDEYGECLIVSNRYGNIILFSS